MTLSNYPDKYLRLLNQSSKNLAVVFELDGLSDIIANVQLYTKIRYGDPGINYGTPGVVYGGLRLRDNVKPYLMVDGNLSISQKIEPEQGRGGISNLSLNFIDKDGYMSRLISPGVVVNEPLGNKAVRVWVGFQNSSYPEDYFVVFRGFVSSTASAPGRVTLKIADPNFKRKGQIFFSQKTDLSTGIDASTTSIPVENTSSFFKQILGIDGTYDPSVITYLKIDNEILTYPATGITNLTTFTTLSRGGGNSRGTASTSHSSGAAVENLIQIQDNPINVALKIMLSGWNGPFKTGIVCRSIGNAIDPSITNTPNMILVDQSVDLEQDLGLTVGDAVTVSGSTAGNNGTYGITDIVDAGGFSNRLLKIDTNLNPESPATGVTLAFRSKYDTLPTACGLKMVPTQVDVITHEQVRDFYLADTSNVVQLFLSSPEQGKSFIESQCFLPFGIYSLTRYGRVSCGITKPPIADQKLIFIDSSVIIDPQNISVTRALDNRRFFNEVQYTYDKRDDGSYKKVAAVLDSTALTTTDYVSVLPITSDGLKASLGAFTVVSQRGRFLLNRFKHAAYEIKFKVFWKVGSQIEVGDVIVLQDEGTLHVTNFADGSRNLGTQPFEVIQRTMNIKDGNVEITLLSSLGFNLSDRYATFSPSSLVDIGSSTSGVRIKDSFGKQFPGNEKRKWERLTGLPIIIHSPDYTTRYGESTLLGIDASDTYKLLINPALSFTPQAGDIVDIKGYSLTSTNPATDKLYKTLFAHFDPSVTVISGVSSTEFAVSFSDASLFVTGNPILVHNGGYSILSPEAKVTSIIGSHITVDTSLGFTPSAGQKVELIGFKDGGGPYRFV